jgi:dolichyl-phosphate beta-glucosyltransferase
VTGTPLAPGVTALVVPCYNEAARLRSEAFLAALARCPSLYFVLVDDGSTDDTRTRLDALAAGADGRASVLALPVNSGKAEAVRQGLLRALTLSPSNVGYWDADLSTPFDALSDFFEVLRRNPASDIVLGSRVKLLGREIVRNPLRHYFGRVFATGASITLGIPVYDTQCGAKLFRATERLPRLLHEPFRSRWSFDVELLARYLDDRDVGSPPDPDGKRIYELALRTWVDTPGSKVRATDGLRALVELARLYRARRR